MMTDLVCKVIEFRIISPQISTFRSDHKKKEKTGFSLKCVKQTCKDVRFMVRIIPSVNHYSLQ